MDRHRARREEEEKSEEREKKVSLYYTMMGRRCRGWIKKLWTDHWSCAVVAETIEYMGLGHLCR